MKKKTPKNSKKLVTKDVIQTWLNKMTPGKFQTIESGAILIIIRMQ